MLLGSHDKCPLQVAGSGVVCLEDLCILNSGTPNVCQSDFKKTWTNSYCYLHYMIIPFKRTEETGRECISSFSGEIMGKCCNLKMLNFYLYQSKICSQFWKSDRTKLFMKNRNL